MGTNTKKYLTHLIYYPLLSLICLEIALLILGYRAYRHTEFSIHAVPEHAYIGHSELGIQLNPGEYKITINDSLSFSTKHSGPAEREMITPSAANQKIAMLGCSYTYGFGVDNSEHFTALLQSDFPQYHFFQRAVVGHGTVQSLILLRQLLTKPKLSTVILNLSSYHLMRNTLSPTYRAHLKLGYQHSNKEIDNLMHMARFPYKETCADPIQYLPWSQIYQHWYGREWSATINWLQTHYDRWHEDHQRQIDVTACLIEEMIALCKSQNIDFIVVALDESEAIKELERQLPTVPWINVNFDFSDPMLTNHPYDQHPSVKGHQYIAQKIKPLLNNRLNVE